MHTTHLGAVNYCNKTDNIVSNSSILPVIPVLFGPNALKTFLEEKVTWDTNREVTHELALQYFSKTANKCERLSF